MKTMNIGNTEVLNITPYGEEQLYIVAVYVGSELHYFTGGNRSYAHHAARELRNHNVEAVVVKNY